MQLLSFVLADHFLLACVAALWFFSGALLALPVARWRKSWAQAARTPLLRVVAKLLGRRPGLVRMALTIFAFNSTAMLLYMSAGFRALVPQLIALLTGFTLALCLTDPAAEGVLLPDGVRLPARWRPNIPMTVACGIATVVLELPCFWFSIAMGMSLGEAAIASAGIGAATDAAVNAANAAAGAGAATAAAGAATGATTSVGVVSGPVLYWVGLKLRIHAYAALIVPVLFVSAWAETAAIAGASSFQLSRN